ncbi:MAG: hypothetical protein KJZ78_22470 [Bryobacteraceae bacterium]|nr:hypothetical protein [Bryobacteraceae bacterium]
MSSVTMHIFEKAVQMWPRFAVSIAGLTILGALAGCMKAGQLLGSTWHQKCGWKAEDYFDDPQVVALCRAIEANDLDEIDRLITAGVNVNAKGKGNMTPLLWAFPDNKLERFKRLLEHGADPNVIIEDDFNTRGGMSPGDSVTHMACGTAFPGYFDAVFEHGGDPNLVKSTRTVSKATPLFTLIEGRAREKARKIKILIDKGADINYLDGNGLNPTMTAVAWGGQYDLALLLLEEGADFKIYKPRENSRLVHAVVARQHRTKVWTAQQREDCEKLVQWLTEHGESIEQAKQDQERWKSWSMTTGEYRRKMDAEIAERKAREMAAAIKDDDAR